MTRPANRSDFNHTNAATRAQARILLGLLVIRELPIKSFYARCWIAYFYSCYFVVRGLGRGFQRQRPQFVMNHQHHMRSLLNYPDLGYWVMGRAVAQHPVQPNPHKEWRLRQTPVFHQFHKVVYRYRYRKPRYVPWDGTMNQPVMPFLVDHGTDVINGTFKRNANTVPQLK